MLSVNIACIVFGVMGFLCVAVCAARELTVALRRARDAKRRYIKE